VFVNSVCEEFRVQLLIGGVDDPELRYPLISNADILLLGRITNLTNIGEFVLFVSKLLSEKYPKESTPPFIRSKVRMYRCQRPPYTPLARYARRDEPR
jgi:hypothetical protein